MMAACDSSDLPEAFQPRRKRPSLTFPCTPTNAIQRHSDQLVETMGDMPGNRSANPGSDTDPPSFNSERSPVETLAKLSAFIVGYWGSRRNARANGQEGWGLASYLVSSTSVTAVRVARAIRSASAVYSRTWASGPINDCNVRSLNLSESSIKCRHAVTLFNIASGLDRDTMLAAKRHQLFS